MTPDTPAHQQQEANTCIHSQVCRYRFINDAPCSSLVCQYFATHTSPRAPAEDTVTMPRWVFEFLTRKPIYTDYIVASKDEEAKRIIESLRAQQQGGVSE